LEATEERWTVRYEPASERLFITAYGHATEGKSREAAELFKSALGSKTVELVVELDEMTGYTSEARRVWQETFSPVRAQLKRMVVIGTKVPAMVRMGATVVAAVSGIRIVFFGTLAEADQVR